MIPAERAHVLDQVESQSGCKRQALAVLGVPRSSYYRWRQVVGWGYYYLVTVMDDYSRFILA
jgi:hypothetical protein